MIKRNVNLLPWRILQRHHHLKSLVVILVIWSGMLICSFYLSHLQSEDFIMKKTIIDNQIQQQHHLIERYHKQISQLKKQHTLVHSKKVIYPNIPKLLAKLSQIPIKKVILNELKIKNNIVALRGVSFRQVELDKMTSFLKQQPEINNLQLQHIENSNNQIAFTITFTLEN